VRLVGVVDGSYAQCIWSALRWHQVVLARLGSLQSNCRHPQMAQSYNVHMA
jgi:hypothetical protein